jgi:hypothetical protein
MDSNQKSTLGCGTLILIALIVLIFGNASSHECADEVKRLSQDIKALQTTVSTQTQAIKRLENEMSQALEHNKMPPEKK